MGEGASGRISVLQPRRDGGGGLATPSKPAAELRIEIEREVRRGGNAEWRIIYSLAMPASLLKNPTSHSSLPPSLPPSLPSSP